MAACCASRLCMVARSPKEERVCVCAHRPTFTYAIRKRMAAGGRSSDTNMSAHLKVDTARTRHEGWLNPFQGTHTLLIRRLGHERPQKYASNNLFFVAPPSTGQHTVTQVNEPRSRGQAVKVYNIVQWRGERLFKEPPLPPRTHNLAPHNPRQFYHLPAVCTRPYCRQPWKKR